MFSQQGSSSSTLFKSAPIAGVKNPTDSQTSHKTEPATKPTPTAPKTSEVGGGASVKTQPETTVKPETNVNPTTKVQQTTSQKTSVDVKKDGVAPSRENPKDRPEAKVRTRLPDQRLLPLVLTVVIGALRMHAKQKHGIELGILILIILNHASNIEFRNHHRYVSTA